MLVGHNVESFDSPILIYAYLSCKKLKKISNIVEGFFDNSGIAVIHHNGETRSFILQTRIFMSTPCRHNYDAHYASSDVISLNLCLDI